MCRPQLLVTGDVTSSEKDELAKLEAALRQLERAELYVVGAVDLELEDPFRRRLLDDLRGQIAAVRRSLTRPRIVDQPFSR